MNPEDRQLLQETAELARENNKILRSMRRRARFGTFFRLVYWTLIIGSAIGAYYYIQPYINALAESYASMKQNIEAVKGVTSKLPTLPDWLNTKP